VDLGNVSNGSAVEALWALGALEPKKRLKQAGWGVVERLPKTAPKDAVFCPFSQVPRQYLFGGGNSKSTGQAGLLMCKYQSLRIQKWSSSPSVINYGILN
jgi:hypothetical protein